MGSPEVGAARAALSDARAACDIRDRMKTYERWLIARGNVFSPSGAAVAKLVDSLREEGWILRPAAPELTRLALRGREEKARRSGGFALSPGSPEDGPLAEALPLELDGAWLDDEGREDIRLVWPVRTSEPCPVKAPLSPMPDGAVDFTLEVHRASDFITPTAPSIGALPCACACGEELSYEWDPDEVVSPFGDATGIFTECEECSRTFDPAKRTARIEDPLGGSAEDVPGGAAYRFAVVVTTTRVPSDARVTFSPALVALLEKQFGRSFYEVAAVRDVEG